MVVWRSDERKENRDNEEVRQRRKEKINEASTIMWCPRVRIDMDSSFGTLVKEVIKNVLPHKTTCLRGVMVSP